MDLCYAMIVSDPEFCGRRDSDSERVRTPPHLTSLPIRRACPNLLRRYFLTLYWFGIFRRRIYTAECCRRRSAIEGGSLISSSIRRRYPYTPAYFAVVTPMLLCAVLIISFTLKYLRSRMQPRTFTFIVLPHLRHMQGLSILIQYSPSFHIHCDDEPRWTRCSFRLRALDVPVLLGVVDDCTV